MPYVDETRPYQRTGRFPNHRVAHCQWWKDGVILPPVENGNVVDMSCVERTYSFRNRSQDLDSQPALTGQQLEDAIYHGKVLEIDPRAPGGITMTGDTIRRDGYISSEYDQGHEFRTWKLRRVLSSTDQSAIRRGIHWRYRGHLMITRNDGESYLPDLPVDVTTLERGEMFQLANRAISDSAPTAPEAGLATFVAELRQLPSIPGLSLLRSISGETPRTAVQNLGGEGLNYWFGIKPMISDIQSLSQAVLKSQEIVNQMVRDSGKVVRRRRTLVDQRKTSSVKSGVSLEVTPMTVPEVPETVPRNFIWPAAVQGVVLDQREENIWFSGAFSYFLLESDSLLDRLSNYSTLANRLLGARLDVDTVWELAPWSWLIDWFLDLQSFITRQVRLANDNLVLRYGYVMKSVTASRTLMAPTIPTFYGGNVVTPQSEYTAYRAVRLKSSPYGFGLDVNALSAQRWAILGALGLTKSPQAVRP